MRKIFTVDSEITTANCDCGVEKINKRIVGGQVVNQFTKTWPVYLEDLDNTQFCTGSIISNKHVITAGHCTADREANDIKVVTLTLRKNESKPENIYYVNSVTRNVYFDGITLLYDLSILELTKPLDLNVITPVCLPPFELRKYGELLAMGWGRKQIDEKSLELREVTVKENDFKACNAFWKGILNYVIQFCAAENGKDTCQGDSGGPLMQKSNGKWFLVGNTSFGEKCAVYDYAVYVRISYFVNWIRQLSFTSKA
ncbi:chymotrypsin-like protease CTRL-1 [Leptotrombidium deliense]|uniref:Chymotrypsin-like protease CTRL-1 n=1 Tax=Leptotrombidium deliense TaxID=299467 RepID=A0A443SAU5_9ACAR|nr:chymotrypsin-like protease CTRL-1 [Leptotrombidium deliense]